MNRYAEVSLMSCWGSLSFYDSSHHFVYILYADIQTFCLANGSAVMKQQHPGNGSEFDRIKSYESDYPFKITASSTRNTN